MNFNRSAFGSIEIRQPSKPPKTETPPNQPKKDKRLKQIRLQTMTTTQAIEWLLAIGLRCHRTEHGWEFDTTLPVDAGGAVRLFVREALERHSDDIRGLLDDGSCRSCMKPSSGGKCCRCLLLAMPTHPIFEALARAELSSLARH